LEVFHAGARRKNRMKTAKPLEHQFKVLQLQHFE